MSVSERFAHWLPQNQLAFIINKPLLIIQAQFHTLHIPYRKGRKDLRKGREDTARSKNVWNEKQRGICEREVGDKDFFKREERMRPVTCGSLPEPNLSPFHRDFHLHRITHFSSVFYSLIKAFQLLWDQGRQKKSESYLQRKADHSVEKMSDLKRYLYLFIYLSLLLSLCPFYPNI